MLIKTNNNKKYHISRRRSVRLIIFVITFLLITITGVFFASKFIKTKGYSNLFEFISVTSRNYAKSIGAKPEKISITIKNGSFQKLENKRQLALERNVIINEGDGYVPAVIRHRGKKIHVNLRLKGHMTDHIKGDKWSFRVNVKGNEHLMGMRLFSLQHPGTRNYIYEWIYHRLLSREGVIALRYFFIDVTLNGKKLGIYALEENFDKELIEENQRPAGPVFRFNPNLYWVDRYNEILSDKVVSEFASFTSADFETYRAKKILADSLQYNYFLKGMAFMEAFRRREIEASRVFDIGKFARFFAIMDILGGHFSMDWSDIKFYYNPVTSKLEPVGYESTSLFPARQLAGSYRYQPMSEKKIQSDFHDNLFSDPVFFKEYIRQLEIISEKQYLDNFFALEDKELNENLKIIYSEFPYKNFEKEQYYANQKSIKKMLDSPKALHAFFDCHNNDSLYLQLGVIESLPVEITGILLNDSLIAKPAATFILPAKMRDAYVNYQTFAFRLSGDNKWKNEDMNVLFVTYRIPGASREKKVKVFPYPYKDKNLLKTEMLYPPSNIRDFPFLTVNDTGKIIYVKPGVWEIQKLLIIPDGFIVKATGNTTLQLNNSSGIISFSALKFLGDANAPVKVISTDSTGYGITVLNCAKMSKLKYVHFINLSSAGEYKSQFPGAVTFYESDVSMQNCYSGNCKKEDAVTIIRSNFNIHNSLFENLSNDAVDIKFSDGKISDCSFLNCAEDAIDITSGNVHLDNIIINKVLNKAINVKAHGEVNMNNINISNADIAVSAEDFANLTIDNINVSNSKTGFTAYQNKQLYGPANITATRVTASNNGVNYLPKKKSTITINGEGIK